jgi:predicted aspartyl protease
MEETVVSGGDEPTKVEVRGNKVLVPATLAYGGYEVDVHLVLDTGATRTLIHTDIADQLSINLGKARKTQVRVVGGAVIEARMVRVNSLTVGPHTNRNWDILVVPHQGSAARYDGLLGMDVLRGLKYRVDFKRQLIIWE